MSRAKIHTTPEEVRRADRSYHQKYAQAKKRRGYSYKAAWLNKPAVAKIEALKRQQEGWSTSDAINYLICGDI